MATRSRPITSPQADRDLRPVVSHKLEEAERIEHEQANAWGPSDRTARTAHASGG